MKEVIHITHPNYLLYMMPLLEEFIAAIKPQGITRETMIAYVLQNLNRSYFRLFAAVDEGQPIGFLVLQEAGPPYYATLEVVAVYMRHDGGLFARRFKEEIEKFKGQLGALYLSFCGLNQEMAPKFAKFLGCEEVGAHYASTGKEN